MCSLRNEIKLCSTHRRPASVPTKSSAFGVHRVHGQDVKLRPGYYVRASSSLDSLILGFRNVFATSNSDHEGRDSQPEGVEYLMRYMRSVCHFPGLRLVDGDPSPCTSAGY